MLDVRRDGVIDASRRQTLPPNDASPVYKVIDCNDRIMCVISHVQMPVPLQKSIHIPVFLKYYIPLAAVMA